MLGVAFVRAILRALGGVVCGVKCWRVCVLPVLSLLFVVVYHGDTKAQEAQSPNSTSGVIDEKLPEVTVEPAPTVEQGKKTAKKSSGSKSDSQAKAKKAPDKTQATEQGAASASDAAGEVDGTAEGAAGVGGPYSAGAGVAFGSTIADTGTTTLDAANVKARSVGGGDANSFVRNLPNVQYQNETSKDAGTNPYREIDTKPLEFSISGARPYQNNIILNGISINNVVSPIETGNPQLDEDPYPIVDVQYGMHSQTIYVPLEFLEKATIVDSNASAKYGQFLGGAVIYDLASPPTDRWRASLNYDRHSSKFVNYLLGTEDGMNPLEREAPEFTKDNVALSLGGPISSQLSAIVQWSGKFADTNQQKEWEFFNKWVGMDSVNHFFRVAAVASTEIGRFKFETSVTDYTQSWESEASRDLFINVENKAQTSQIEYKNALPALEYADLGIAGVSITSRAFYNDADMANVSNGDESWFWVAIQRRRANVSSPWETSFDSTMTDEFCRPLPEEALTGTSGNATCREGGWGSLYTGQTDYGIQNELTGRFLWGQFLLGGEAKRIKGTRERPADFTYYSSFNTLGVTPNVTAFECPDEHPACTEEQYASIWITQPAFDIEAAVSTFNLYSEIDQTFGWFNVRAGVRFDYEDYFKNPNFAPRLVGTLAPVDWFSVSAGYNRYYDDTSLAYAIRDAQPRAITNVLTGKHDADGNVPAVWRSTVNAPFGYRAAGLDTPYKDEYTAAVRVKEPVLGGHFRVRYLERYGRDEFSREKCPDTTSSLCNSLSNNGESTYKAWTGEYTAAWRNQDPTLLAGIALTGSITKSEQTANRGTYFEEDGSEAYILYHGNQYTRESFVAVTGNLDIPIRVGGTLTTLWFNSALRLDLNAAFNFGYEGVYDTGYNETIDGLNYDVYDDRTFGDTLLLDLYGEYHLTSQAALVFQINNLTDSLGNSVASDRNPWVRGRSVWAGTKIGW